MYTYFDYLSDVKHLAHLGAAQSVIGYTLLNRPITALHIGSYRGKQVLISASIHAREYLTTKLVIEQAYRFLARREFFGGGVYFLPMINVDGVRLCQEGIGSVPNAWRRQYLLDINGGSFDFSMWKANANAVDLNTNFDAHWGEGSQNVFSPAPQNYVGPFPDSEKETRAMIDFSHKVGPAMTISYHAKGREIYYEFFQSSAALLARDKAYGEVFAKETGYKLVDGDLGSAGGYKDWCIQHLKIPAYTFEIIDDSFEYPLPDSALLPEWEGNKNIPATALKLLTGAIK